MGLLPFALAGAGLILIGAREALDSTLPHHNPPPLNSSTPPPPKQIPQPTNKITASSSSSLFPITLSIFSFFFIINSLVSLFDAHNSNDAVGSALQLQVLALAFIFLFYSVLALFPSLPSTLVSLVGAFAFVEEFLLFYLQRKDPSGVENRYYDLLLVPIAVCVFSTLIELKSPVGYGGIPRMGRGIGLILQGTWFVQMGLSIFSSIWVAEGCTLHQVSRGNYTLRCKGHMEYHRARAIATLQFNCHLALMVVVVVGFYSLICGGRNGSDGRGVNSAAIYKPIGAEMQQFEGSAANFTLDSDGDDDVVVEEIKGGSGGWDVGGQKAVGSVENGMNGLGSHH